MLDIHPVDAIIVMAASYSDEVAKTAPSIFRYPYPLKKPVIPNYSEESSKKYNSLVNIA